ncbi:MAG: prolyl oligopeptidase family serine peptidase [Verrucomicrobiota bacterium]
MTAAQSRCSITLVVLSCLQAAAEPIGDAFRKLDQNGDGRLDAKEAGSMGFFKPADADGDGLVTLREAEGFMRKSTATTEPATTDTESRRTAGMEGDGAAPVLHWTVPPVRVSESDSPVQLIRTTAKDGRDVKAWWRKPKGDGPFPALVFIHGGLNEFPESSLRKHLTDNPVITRFLRSGYAVIMSTFRTYDKEVQSRGPIEDVRAVLKSAAGLPGVDPGRITLYGGSGGGSIALELGADPGVSAVIACEPATVIYTGMLTTGEYGPRLEMMAEPEKHFTAELRARTMEKLRRIKAPVLIVHGDMHDLRKLNKPIFLPLMRQAGVRADYLEYAGYGHGFYFGGGDDRWGKGADLAVVEKVVADVRSFLEPSKIPIGPER